MRTPSDWGQPCPNPECPQYNLLHRGNVKALATYQTQVAAAHPRDGRCLTEQVWTFRELLTVKFEPLHSQSISG